jgi:hypothetical protein
MIPLSVKDMIPDNPKAGYFNRRGLARYRISLQNEAGGQAQPLRMIKRDIPSSGESITDRPSSILYKSKYCTSIHEADFDFNEKGIEYLKRGEIK